MRSSKLALRLVGSGVLAVAICPVSIAQTDDPNVVAPRAADAPLSAGVVDAFVRFLPGEPLRPPTDQTLVADAWRGERVSAQIILTVGLSVNNISIASSALTGPTGTIPASAVRIRREAYATADGVARSCPEKRQQNGMIQLPDPLLALGKFTMTAADPVKLFVTIDVPRDAAPGVYNGTIVVSGHRGAAKSLAVAITVAPHRLPSPREGAFHLDLWQFPGALLDRYNDSTGADIAYWSPEHLAMLEPQYRLLADLGQRTTTTYIVDGAAGYPSMIGWARSGSGEWSFDHTAFDRYVAAADSWGLGPQISAFSLLGWNGGTIRYRDGATGRHQALKLVIGSAEWKAMWNRFLSDFRTHLKKKGWFDRTVLYLDEVPEPNLTAALDLIGSHDPAWKIGLAHGHELPPSTTDRIYDLSTIYGIALPPKSAGTLRTVYTSCTQTRPNLTITGDNQPAEAAWLPAHSVALERDGALRWAFDYWQAPRPFDARDTDNSSGDNMLVYRDGSGGRMKIVPSIRYELLRRGIQNMEKLFILRRIAAACGPRPEDIALETKLASFSTFTSDTANQVRELEAALRAASDRPACLAAN